MQTQPSSSLDHIIAAIAHQPVAPIPRGELWLGSELFKHYEMDDTVENHFRLAERLGQDIVCISLASDLSNVPDLGYRYFSVDEIKSVTRYADAFVAAVVDGPFQALVNRMGLMEVLMGWAGEREEIVAAYVKIQEETTILIEKCLACGVHGIVIADDLSGDQGPLISPADIKTLCDPFYKQAVSRIHSADATAFVHCCGNIHPLIQLYTEWGIDGLAAVQHGVNDLTKIRQVWETPPVIMAGIDLDLIENKAPTTDTLKSFEELISSLAPAGGLILGTACGLYQADFLPRLKALYEIADNQFASL